MDNNKLLSAPVLMVIGMLLIVGSVGLLQTKSLPRVSVSKPLSEAAAFCVKPNDVKYDLVKDGCFDNKDVNVVATAIKNKAFLATADFDGNKKVDVADLVAIRFALFNILSNTLGNQNPSAANAYYDLNLDGAFNNKDVKLVADAITAQKAGIYTPMADVACTSSTSCFQTWGGGFFDGGGVDAKIDAGDLAAIRKILIQVNKSFYLDLDLSGKVNSKDIQMVKSKLGSQDVWANVDTGSSWVEKSDYQMIGDYAFDITGDGRVDNADSDYISYVSRKFKLCPTGKNCDVDGDGYVSLSDSVIILNYIKAIASM